MNKAKSSKKISFASMVLIVVGSIIGAGIFVKNQSLVNLTEGRISLVIIAWLLGGFSIICIGLALFELSSASKENRGIIEWSNNFLPKPFKRFASNFIALFYYPVNIIALSVYVVAESQKVLDVHFTGIEAAGLSLLVALLTSGSSGFSLAWGEKAQWFVTGAKLIPVILLPIFAFTTNNGPAHYQGKIGGLAGSSPFLGFFATIPAIIFSYAGFYRAAALRNNMKNPTKGSKATLIALCIVTTIYLIFSTSFLMFTNDGKYSNLNVPWWLIRTVNVLICIAVYGVANGYSMAAPNVIQSIWVGNELRQPRILKRFKKDRHASTLFVMFLITTYFVIFATLSLTIYKANASGVAAYGASAAPLYAMANLLTNWIAMVVFSIIAYSLIGGIINRKTKKILVVKYKHFVWMSIVGATYMTIGILFMAIQQIVDITGYNNADQISAVTNLSVLFLSVLIGLLPIVTSKIHKKPINNKLDYFKINIHKSEAEIAFETQASKKTSIAKV